MSTHAEPDAPLDAAAPMAEPPRTGDATVDSVLTEFVAQTADSGDLSERIEAATNAHRQLQARLTADRER